jgi:hypothetical protein
LLGFKVLILPFYKKVNFGQNFNFYDHLDNFKQVSWQKKEWPNMHFFLNLNKASINFKLTELALASYAC